ncbi:response regulator [Anaeroselena agilis]|uniref:Transcriptional regulatory protein n=1 Tax=Anaeroselena agilis TaxID=3063788 RepID=A0ABU3NWF9_9FIRM|nr:response regulator [Selenomonadales bacterium 4137-cl]
MIKVLIVEDDPMVAEFNRRYLARTEGFELVAVASSGDEALDIIARANVDLVLLDIFMPGKTGLEFLGEIRRAGRGVDVIVVTAAADRGSIQQALQYGAVDYLIKPFEFERLNASLTAYRERIRLMRRSDVLSQADLDRRILHKDLPARAELPKGLDRNTLRRVWTRIAATGGAAFSTGDMASAVGISRVSMRKYLDFLTRQGVLHVEAVYGAVGRPVYKYRCVNADEALVARYW